MAEQYESDKMGARSNQVMPLGPVLPPVAPPPNYNSIYANSHAPEAPAPYAPPAPSMYHQPQPQLQQQQQQQHWQQQQQQQQQSPPAGTSGNSKPSNVCCYGTMAFLSGVSLVIFLGCAVLLGYFNQNIVKDYNEEANFVDFYYYSLNIEVCIWFICPLA